MSSTAELVVKIVADTRNAATGVDQAAGKYSKFRSGVSAAAKGATVVLAGLTATAISFGKAAADDQRSQAVLAQTLKNTTGAGQKQIAGMEAFIDATSRASGVADDELRPALGTLARATGDLG